MEGQPVLRVSVIHWVVSLQRQVLVLTQATTVTARRERMTVTSVVNSSAIMIDFDGTARSTPRRNLINVIFVERDLRKSVTLSTTAIFTQVCMVFPSFTFWHFLLPKSCFEQGLYMSGNFFFFSWSENY